MARYLFIWTFVNLRLFPYQALEFGNRAAANPVVGTQRVKAYPEALPAGKAAGLDEIFPKFLKHDGTKVEKWLVAVCDAIIATDELPNAFKRSKIVAILKPGKEPEQAESYRQFECVL